MSNPGRANIAADDGGPARSLKLCAKRRTGFGVPSSSSTIVCDTSTGIHQPFVPAPLRMAVFHALHDISHPGIRQTERLASSKYVWPRMKTDVRRWENTCQQCQRSKVYRHTKTPLIPFRTPDQWFAHVHIDIVGPLAPSRGRRYILTCVDRYTRWPEARPLPEILAETVAHAFVFV